MPDDQSKAITFSCSITSMAYSSAAMASSELSSGYESRIRSVEYPPAIMLSMLVTIIRVPLIVGLPLQMAGSTTILPRSSNSFGFGGHNATVILKSSDGASA